MKLALARKILKNFSLDKLMIGADLEAAELKQRLRIRQSAIELLMREGNADRLSAYAALETMLRYHRSGNKWAKTLNRHVWRRCGVCQRPIYTTTISEKNYCRQHYLARLEDSRRRCDQRWQRNSRKQDMYQAEEVLAPEMEEYLAQTVTVDLLRRISTAKAGEDLQAYRQAVAEVSAALIARFACDPQEAAWIAAQVIIKRERELWVQLKLL